MTPNQSKKAPINSLVLVAVQDTNEPVGRQQKYLPVTDITETSTSGNLVTTVAEFRASNDIPTNRAVITIDYGGGTWYYAGLADGEVDNTGTVIITADNHVWKRLFTGDLSLEWFVGPGGTSSNFSTVVQSAFDVAAASGIMLDGGWLTVKAQDIVINNGLKIKNINFVANSALTYILRAGQVGYTPSDPITTAIVLDEISFTGDCTYGLIISNAVNFRISNLHFDAVHCTEDAFYFNGSYNGLIDKVRFEGSSTVGDGKSCLYIPGGVNAVNLIGIYTSAFTDYGVKIDNGSALTFEAPVIQGAVEGIYVLGCQGLIVNNPYFENTVNPVTVIGGNGSVSGTSFNGGMWIGPFAEHPEIAQNNGVMVLVTDALVELNNIRFTGVFAGALKNIASVDGLGVIQIYNPIITGTVGTDIRQYLYRESTAISVAGYTVDQIYENNSRLRVERLPSLGWSHVTTARAMDGKIKESRSWVPAINGSGVQTVTDLWVESVDKSDIDGISADILSKTLSPSQDLAYYIPSYNVTSPVNDVPNVTGIKDLFLTVTGTLGSKTLTVNSGDQSSFTGQFQCVIFHAAANKYISYLCYSVSGGTITLATPLLYAATADVMHTMWDQYLGQHLTTFGYRAYADYVFDFSSRYALKNNAYVFAPELNPTETPFTLIGGAATGGYAAGTSDLVVSASVTTATLNNASQLSSHFFGITQKGAGKGIQWSVPLGGKSGYLEANVGLLKYDYHTPTLGTTAGIARVIVTIDGADTTIDVTGYINQIVRVPFSKATQGVLKIVTGDGDYTAIAVNRVGWYIGVESTGAIDFSGRGVFLGDSWTQYQDGNRDFPERVKTRIAASGGDPSLVTNSGRSGMTTKWARYWFNELVLAHSPEWCVIEFFTNDVNSADGGTGWNFSSTSPFDSGTDVTGNVTYQEWKDNIDWMTAQCFAHGIQPIVMTPSGGQVEMDNLMSKLSTSKYYDVKVLSSNAALIETTATAKDFIGETVSVGSATVTTTIEGGTADVGGSFKIFSKEVNSGAAEGVVIGSKVGAERTGGNVTTIKNGAAVLGYMDSGGNFTATGELRTGASIKIGGLYVTSFSISPEGAIAAPVGSLCLNTSNGIVYQKVTGTSTAGWKPMPSQAAAQADSGASTVAGIVSDFNALLAKLRTSGAIAP